MTDLIPLKRTDNGDGTVTWAPVMDPRTRKSHQAFKSAMYDFPYAEIPEMVFPRPRCFPLVQKEPTE